MPSLKQLQYFHALARRGNMTALAEELFVSQTALSNAISRLEDELGVQLFERSGRTLVLNEYGAVYLPHVESMLFALENANAAVNRLKGGTLNNVSIAMNSPVLWGDIIAGFLSEHRDCTITQQECMVDSMQKMLPKLDVDLILAGKEDFSSDTLDHVIFSRDRLWLCVPPGHWLSGRRTMKLIEARNENFICQPGHTGFARFSRRIFQAAGFEPKVVAECDYEMRRELFRQNVGVLVATDSVLRVNYYGYGSSVLIEGPSTLREMALFWSNTRRLSPIAVTFKETLLSVYRNNPFPEYWDSVNARPGRGGHYKRRH